MVKNILFVMLGVVGMTIIGCLDEVKVESGTYTLQEGELVSVSDEITALLKVVAIEDSRCPINAQCVTAGAAKVQVQLLLGDDIDFDEVLCLGADCGNKSDKARIKLGSGEYNVLLKEVNPFPTTNLDIVIKTAVLELVPVGD